MRGRAGEAGRADRRSASAGRCAPRAIGEVTGTRSLRVLDGDELVGDMPVEALVDDCPLYDLEPAEPSEPVYPDPPRRAGLRRPPARCCWRCSARPTSPRSAGAVRAVRLDRRLAHGAPPEAPTPRCSARAATAAAGAIAVSIDGNGRRVACDPYTGTVEAVLECARNLACVGAEPLGLTNCLNFGNPEKPHVAWQLTALGGGPGRRLPALGVPVVGGNVSLYNESGDGPIYPTPVVGMVGKLPDPARAPGSASPRRATRSRCAGTVRARRSRARSWRSCAGGLPAGLPAVDLDDRRGALAELREAVRAGELSSVHDVVGGRALRGARRVLHRRRHRARAWTWPRGTRRALFGEASGRRWSSRGRADALEAVPGAVVIGAVGGDSLRGRGRADAFGGRSCARPTRAPFPAPCLAQSALTKARVLGTTVARRRP